MLPSHPFPIIFEPPWLSRYFADLRPNSLIKCGRDVVLVIGIVPFDNHPSRRNLAPHIKLLIGLMGGRLVSYNIDVNVELSAWEWRLL